MTVTFVRHNSNCTYASNTLKNENAVDKSIVWKEEGRIKLQLHDAIYRLRFYLNSLIRILSLSNSHNNVASIQKNRGDKSHRVIVALENA